MPKQVKKTRATGGPRRVQVPLTADEVALLERAALKLGRAPLALLLRTGGMRYAREVLGES